MCATSNCVEYAETVCFGFAFCAECLEWLWEAKPGIRRDPELLLDYLTAYDDIVERIQLWGEDPDMSVNAHALSEAILAGGDDVVGSLDSLHGIKVPEGPPADAA